MKISKELIDKNFEIFKVKKILSLSDNPKEEFLLIMTNDLSQILNAYSSGLLQDSDGTTLANAHFCYIKNKKKPNKIGTLTMSSKFGEMKKVTPNKAISKEDIKYIIEKFEENLRG